MINKFLVINENTRRRALQIRTYVSINYNKKCIIIGYLVAVIYGSWLSICQLEDAL